MGDSAFIKKENLVKGKIIQQDKEAWRKFLLDCHKQRTNDQGKASEWDPSQALKHRWSEAEEIYKNFNALWTGRGFIADGNQAYVQGCRMELRRMCVDLCENSTQ